MSIYLVGDKISKNIISGRHGMLPLRKKEELFSFISFLGTCGNGNHLLGVSLVTRERSQS